MIGLCLLTADEKQALVSKHTGGRVTSSSEMESEEMDAAIRDLIAERRQVFRRYMPVIGLCCHALGWTVIVEGHREIDMPSLNGYIQKYYKKKSLYRLTNEEFGKLVVSLKKIAEAKGVKL